MMTPDIINGTFEALGAAAVWLNVRQIVRDKKLAGCRWDISLFFTGWSLWNLYYYPSLGQWASLIGGAGLFTANAAWTILAIYYSRRADENEK